MFGIPPTVQLQILVVQHCFEATVIVPEQAPPVLATAPSFTKAGLAAVVPHASGAPAIATAPPNSMAKLKIATSIRIKRMTFPCLSLGSDVININ